MGKRNRKGKENNPNRSSFLKVENTIDLNPEVETPSQNYASIGEEVSIATVDIPLVTKEDENTKAHSIGLDYPTIGDLVSSVEKLSILKELEVAFPDMENTLIKAILIASQGALEPAFNSLLYYSNPNENTDFALPMKPIGAQDFSKIEVPEILQYEILNDIENEVSDQEIESQMQTSVTATKTGPGHIFLADPTNITKIPKSNREVAESTRNLTIADEHDQTLSKEKGVFNAEEKGVNRLKGAAVKTNTKPLGEKCLPAIEKRNEPSNNLFDVLNCDESEDGEQEIEVDASNQEIKNNSGNCEEIKVPDEKETSETKDNSTYKSVFGTDSCGLFTVNGRGAKQLQPSTENKK